MPNPHEKLKEFDEFCRVSGGIILWNNNSKLKKDLKSFLLQALKETEAQTREKVIEIINVWKNEGGKQTETDLVLENILKQINKT